MEALVVTVSAWADDVEMAAALVGIKHDADAQTVGAKASRLVRCGHSRRRAGVPCASQVGSDAGSTPSRGVRRGYMASLLDCAS